MRFGEPKVILIKDVKRTECDWLPCDFAKGSVFYVVDDKAHVCTDYGTPCSLSPKGEPYYEIPNNAIQDFIGILFSAN